MVRVKKNHEASRVLSMDGSRKTELYNVDKEIKSCGLFNFKTTSERLNVYANCQTKLAITGNIEEIGN